MKKLLLLMIAICLVSSTRGAVDPQKVKPVKNVILMVTDGTSISAVSLARWLQYYQNPDMPNLNLTPICVEQCALRAPMLPLAIQHPLLLAMLRAT